MTPIQHCLAAFFSNLLASGSRCRDSRLPFFLEYPLSPVEATCRAALSSRTFLAFDFLRNEFTMKVNLLKAFGRISGSAIMRKPFRHVAYGQSLQEPESIWHDKVSFSSLSQIY